MGGAAASLLLPQNAITVPRHVRLSGSARCCTLLLSSSSPCSALIATDQVEVLPEPKIQAAPPPVSPDQKATEEANSKAIAAAQALHKEAIRERRQGGLGLHKLVGGRGRRAELTREALACTCFVGYRARTHISLALHRWGPWLSGRAPPRAHRTFSVSSASQTGWGARGTSATGGVVDHLAWYCDC